MSIFLENWQLIIGAGTTLTAFIYGYKKQRTDNISDIQNVYNGLIKDVENRIDTMRKQTQENSDKMLEMEIKIQELQGINAEAVVHVGEIVDVDGVYDDEGNEITPPTFIDGWHVDVMLKEDIDFGEYEVFPNNPVHKFFEV